MADQLTGKKILITGPAGQVALPVTRALAADNEVIGIARFRDADVRAELEGLGVRCSPVDLAAGDFGDVPDDVDYVLNLAVVKSNRWEVDLRGNAEATGLLMAHCRSATAFLHCSSTGVYAHAGTHQLVADLRRQLAGGDEDQALGPAGLALADGGDHGDAEGDRLARTRRRLAAQVAAGERVGDGHGLDGERGLDATRVKAPNDVGGHAEIGELVGHGLDDSVGVAPHDA